MDVRKRKANEKPCSQSWQLVDPASTWAVGNVPYVKCICGVSLYRTDSSWCFSTFHGVYHRYHVTHVCVTCGERFRDQYGVTGHYRVDPVRTDNLPEGVEDLIQRSYLARINKTKPPVEGADE